MDEEQEKKWIIRFYILAQYIATWSKDPERKVGAVIVSPGRREFSLGYNGMPTGILDSAERLANPDIKLPLTVHAELNAILNARKSVVGHSLVCTDHVCHECAAAIIQAGIGFVVMPPVRENSKWTSSHQLANSMLTEAGIKIITVENSDE
jgi:dCMP deaminase